MHKTGIILEMTECPSVYLVMVMVYSVIDLWAFLSYIQATSLMLVSAQCKTAGHGACLFQWVEHSLVKAEK